ncbi:MAG: hypothetical protein ACKVT0_09250 [Planctomycetaceae bacterium]
MNRLLILGWCCGWIAVCCLPLSHLPAESTVTEGNSSTILLQVEQQIPSALEHDVQLVEGQRVEISVLVQRPSQLPDNGRLLVDWKLVESLTPELIPRAPAEGTTPARPIDALNIYTAPTPNWSKVLHALDGDTYVVYRAPVAGTYRLTVSPFIGDVDRHESERWREAGKVPEMAPILRQMSWPDGARVDVSAKIRTLDCTGEAEAGMWIEAEPNDTPEQAQPLALKTTGDEQVLHVVGGADDIEYFDNGRFSKSGDDWFRLEFPGPEPRLLSASLSIPDQQVVAQVRCYMLEADQATVRPGELLPLTVEYEE